MEQRHSGTLLSNLSIPMHFNPQLTLGSFGHRFVTRNWALQSFRFREAWFGGQKPGRRAARSLGSGSRPATSSPASTPGGRTAGRGIAGPSSPTSRSTSPRCPAACRWRSMTEGTPEKVRTCKRSELMVLFSHQNNFGGTVIPCYGTVTMTRIMMVIAFFSRSRRITASDTIPARCTEQWHL